MTGNVKRKGPERDILSSPRPMLKKKNYSEGRKPLNLVVDVFHDLLQPRRERLAKTF